jgi:hypothetical protein
VQTREIFYPVLVLAFWTFLVLALVPVARFRSAFRGEVRPNDFKYGESSKVPDQVSVPNRNYMNLLEMPVLFYTVCVLLYVTGGASSAAVACAWGYVGLRVVHSLIHLTYNNVIHRLSAFALSNLVLLGLWVVAATHVA